MILPHLKPIRFAQNIIEVNDKTSLVQCEFPFAPTLAMFCEAAAQSSASYNQQTSNKDEQIGFLVTLKNAKLLKETTDKVFDIKLNKNIDLGNMSEYSFEVIKNNTVYATGIFTIVLQ